MCMTIGKLEFYGELDKDKEIAIEIECSYCESIIVQYTDKLSAIHIIKHLEKAFNLERK